MPVTVNTNGLSTVHRGSGGMASATLPDVCKTPSASGSPVPVPYPNVAMSSDLVQGTTTVTVDGQMAAIQGSKFLKSTGDEAGVAGGVVSQVFMMEATFISFSPTVTMDGRPVCRLTDKMLMNRGNTSCLGGEMQSPVPPPMCPPAPQPEVPKLCVFEKLSLRCDHSSRGYELKAYAQPGATLQVLANKAPEKVHFTFSGSCGVTSESPGCAKVHVIGERNNELPMTGDATVEFALPGGLERFGGDWLALITNLTSPNGFPSDLYTVYGTTCHGTGKEAVPAGEYALIEVFPNAGWEGELAFGYKHDKKKLRKGVTSSSQLDEQGTFELSGKITATVGRTDLSFEAGIEGDGAKKDSDPISRQLFKTTQSALDRMARMLSSIEDFYATKLDIRWPSLKISGGVKLAEVDGGPKVRAEGSFALEASPLIGLQVKIDILEWLIRMAGSLGGPGGAMLADLLLKIKHRIAEKKTIKGQDQNANLNVTAEIGIQLTAGGDIGGGLGWTIKQGTTTIDPSKARIEGGVDFKLEALVKGDLTIWVIKASAGASISMVAADGAGPSRITGKLVAKDGPGFGVKRALEFNGLAIYYAYYADIGADAFEGDPAKPAPSGVKHKQKAGQRTHAVKELKSLCTLLDAWTIPKAGAANVVGVIT